MKKRLIICICILLVIGIVGSFFGMLPCANACEEGSLYEDYKVELIDGYGTIVKNTPMRESIYNPQDEDPWLKPGDRVYVKFRVIDGDFVYYRVSMGWIGEGEVNYDAVRLDTQPSQSNPSNPSQDGGNSSNPSQEGEDSREPVGKHGTITQKVIGLRNLGKSAPDDPQFEKGCRVWVKEKIYQNKKWWYYISFGKYGTAYVPISAVQLDGQSTPSNPSQDGTTPSNPSQDGEDSRETMVGKHGTINRNVMVYRNVPNAGMEEVQLNSGCVVYVRTVDAKGFYTVSFGQYGIFEKVPVDAVTLKEGKTSNKANRINQNAFRELHENS